MNYCQFAWLLSLLTSAPLLFGESFANLDFEAAQIAGSVAQFNVPTSTLFPSWTLKFDDRVAATGNYQAFLLNGLPQGVLYSSDFGAGYSLAGHYSAVLDKGVFATTSLISLSQTGLIPSDAKSMSLLAGGSYFQLDVELNGQSLPLQASVLSANVTQFTVDVSAFAGQTTTLQIGTRGSPITTSNPTGQSIVELDQIQFSSQPVPEPATLSLFTTAIAALSMASRQRR